MFLLLVAALTAGATTFGVHQLPCPIGGGPVKVYDKFSSNASGGYDSDLASYSSEGQYRQYAVSTCPDNLFSLYGSDMSLKFDDATLRTLRAGLSRDTAALSDPQTPTTWERYEIAAHMYKLLGRDPLFIAQLYIEASWTARDQAVGVYEGLNGPFDAQKLLDQGRVELARQLPAAQRRILLYNLARIAHRAGYGELRDRYLDLFEHTGTLDDSEQRALATFRHIAHEVEPRLQDLAIKSLQQGLRQEGLDIDTKFSATYQFADLLRRRGRTSEAMAMYALVLGDERAPMNLREMALLLSRELAGDTPSPLTRGLPAQ